jgi:glycosyltransferase involved in cell wall biosynthesis
MRIFWVAPNNLLDVSSGASQAVRELLQFSSRLGHEVIAISSTVFDSEMGARKFWSQLKTEPKDASQTIQVSDGNLGHWIAKSSHWRSGSLTLQDLDAWSRLVRRGFELKKPDVIVLYGGTLASDWSIRFAKDNGISVAFYLANGNYKNGKIFELVDVVLTDSQATADLYFERFGLACVPLVGQCIDPKKIFVARRTPKYVTFVNSGFAKGAIPVAQAALALEKCRPDVKFLVVESRGEPWSEAVKIARVGSDEQFVLSNVTLVKPVGDIRTILQETKILLHPSLWHESSSRLVLEATINGIPTVVTGRGGQREMAGSGGTYIDFGKEMYESPFDKMASETEVAALVSHILKLWDDQEAYAAKRSGALEHAQSFDPVANCKKFIEALEALQ